MEKSWVLPRNLRNPQYPPAPVRAPAEPRAPGKRSPPCSPARQDARKGTRSPRGCPGSVRRPPRRCQGAAQKFTARPGPNAAHRPGLREPQSHRAPPLPRPQARKAHRGPGGPPALSASPRRAKFNFAGPRPLGAAGWGRAGPPTGSRAKPVRLPGPLIRRASLGARPRGVGGAGGGPGGCAARRLPTFPPPPHSRESPRAGPRARQCARAALPSTAGGGGGGQAGARGGARRRSRGRAAAAPGAAAAPRARSAGGPRGSPWAGFGPLRGEAFSRTGAPLLFRGTGGVHNPPCPIEHARPGRAGHRSRSGAWGSAKPSV